MHYAMASYRTRNSKLTQRPAHGRDMCELKGLLKSAPVKATQKGDHAKGKHCLKAVTKRRRRRRPVEKGSQVFTPAFWACCPPYSGSLGHAQALRQIL
jgi:hypothetical protein